MSHERRNLNGWTVQLRRRRSWAIGALAVGLLVTAALAWRTEPTYTASARVALEEMRLPGSMTGSVARDYVADHLRQTQNRLGGAHLRLDDIDIAAPGTDGVTAVSATFDLVAEAADADAAQRRVTTARQRLLDEDRSNLLPPGVTADAVEAASLQLQRLAEELAATESALETFRQENAAALPGFEQVNEQTQRESERERAELDARRRQLESRRNDLDRGLADMRTDYRRLNRAAPLTNETLAARQMELAALRGLYGPDYGPASELAREIADLQAGADARLEDLMRELDTVAGELARLERSHPPDHPDVIRATYQVSLLETRAREFRITGLSAGDRNYIEGIARERRGIDGAIEEVQTQIAALDEGLAQQQARATQAPLIAQRHAALEQQVAALSSEHEAARQRHAALSAEHRIALAMSPGRLTAAGEPVVGRRPVSTPATVAALGGLLSVIAALLLAGFVDRIDKRVTGVAAIERLQGRRPLVEIPPIGLTMELGVASGRRFAAASVISAAVAAGLLLTALAVDDFRALLTAIGN